MSFAVFALPDMATSVCAVVKPISSDSNAPSATANAATWIAQTCIGVNMDRFADRMEIRDLPSRYAFFVDTFRTDEIMSLWAPDAIFDESRVGTGIHQGAPAIRKFFEGLEKTITHQAHINANHVIENRDVSRASGIVFCAVEAITVAGPMRAVIYYADNYVKLGGRWRFASRVVHPLMPFDTSALGAAEAKVMGFDKAIS